MRKLKRLQSFGITLVLENNSLPLDVIDQVKKYLLQLQNIITSALEILDTKAYFIEDAWERSDGGGGITRVLSKGAVFSKAGVNFSHVFGARLPDSATAQKPELAGKAFQALGLSLVLHPENPYIPTVHANVRFFIAYKEGSTPVWWFGGGMDLTPYYGFVEDCQHWHGTLKQACQAFGASVYPQFKKCCDAYFYLKHREEARGIGGIFFDDYHEVNFEHSFSFMQSVGDHFLKAYCPIVERRKNHPFGLREKKFQHYRRGRYVEFNLIYDRGTLFGLQSGGRTESILVSLPPEVSWDYNWQPEANSPESKLYTDFLPAREWV